MVRKLARIIQIDKGTYYGIVFPSDFLKCLSFWGIFVDSVLQKEKSLLFQSMLMASKRRYFGTF